MRSLRCGDTALIDCAVGGTRLSGSRLTLLEDIGHAVAIRIQLEVLAFVVFVDNEPFGL
jgi:hypothetical protein